MSIQSRTWFLSHFCSLKTVVCGFFFCMNVKCMAINVHAALLMSQLDSQLNQVNLQESEECDNVY